MRLTEAGDGYAGDASAESRRLERRGGALCGASRAEHRLPAGGHDTLSLWNRWDKLGFVQIRRRRLALFENLEAGARVDDFLEWFPGVTREQVALVLRHAEQSLATVSA